MQTIRKNPKRKGLGKLHYPTGRQEIRFSYKGKILQWLIDGMNNKAGEDFMTTLMMHSHKDGLLECSGYINNPDAVDKFTGEGFSVEINREVVSYDTLGLDPEYLFDYEKITLECANCRSHIIVKDIIRDWESNGEDEFEFKMCPECMCSNTFEDHIFETITGALKRKEAAE